MLQNFIAWELRWLVVLNFQKIEFRVDHKNSKLQMHRVFAMFDYLFPCFGEDVNRTLLEGSILFI